MKRELYNIFPLGAGALTIEFGNRISIEMNDRAVGLSEYFTKNPFPGLIETVPAYASTTIFYDVFLVRKNFPAHRTAFETVGELTRQALDRALNENRKTASAIEIPIDFGEKHALDLDFIASRGDLSKEKVIEIFCAKEYRVFMLGFLPGFAYMGEVDERISAPRRRTPRLVVPRGSVGIAGRQTGVYPFDSPGGWRIVGRTDFELFTPDKDIPCALRPGDAVKFVALKK